MEMELKSVKSQSASKLARLTQIEKRLAHLEGLQNRPASREGHDNDDDRYYSYDNMQWIDDSGFDPQDY